MGKEAQLVYVRSSFSNRFGGGGGGGRKALFDAMEPTRACFALDSEPVVVGKGRGYWWLCLGRLVLGLVAAVMRGAWCPSVARGGGIAEPVR